MATGDDGHNEAMSNHPQRRIDQVRDPAFLADLETMPLNELRHKRSVCDQLDAEYAYYRRLIHGRMDLLNFELRRRLGEEERTLIEALPEILAGPLGERNPTGRQIPLHLPDLPSVGRRAIDRVLQDDFLTHIGGIDSAELVEIQQRLTEAETEISAARKVIYGSLERLQAELTRRYREGLADPTELIRTD